MQTYRTPDDRFADLPGFPWPPRTSTWPTRRRRRPRMAYVEAGPADGPVALLLHGEPSWSYLYRHVIAVLAEAGIRCVAPDLVGFGRSTSRWPPADHTFARHVEWVRELAFDHLDLRDVTLVGQDWGGLIGLRLVAEHPDRFARVVAANTGLPTGDFDMPEIWWMFHDAVASRGTRHRPVRRRRLRARPGRRSAGGVRRAVPRRGGKAGPGRCRRWCPPGPTTPPPRPTGRPGPPWAVGQAVPDRLQRLRPDHRRDGADPPAARPRRRRPRPPDHRRTPATSSRRTPAPSSARGRRLHAAGGIVRDVCMVASVRTTQMSRTIPATSQPDGSRGGGQHGSGHLAAPGRAGGEDRGDVRRVGGEVGVPFWIGSSVGDDRVGHRALQGAVRRRGRRPSRRTPRGCRAGW